MIIGVILVTGCIGQTKILGGTQPKAAVTLNSPVGDLKGPLSVSIGDYTGTLPVYIDNTSVGEVSAGTPLNINVDEGHHAVRVCDGAVCEQVDTEIKYAIKTSIDFGERLLQDVPRGLLSVSIGSYNAKLPVYLDDACMGDVSKGRPLNVSLNEGRYLVRVCSGSVCERQGVEIRSGEKNVVDFGERLAKSVPQGPLSVSIGGYDADNLPVSIDDCDAGNVSQGKPLNLMLCEGNHTVKVCVGIICETEDAEIKFAKQSFIDFEERLKKDVEFPRPTVRIASSFLSGNEMTMNAEFINSDKKDLTMTATVGCGYSYIDYNSRERKNDFARTQISRFVKAGDRQVQPVTLYLSKGSYVIASEPMVVDTMIT